MTEQETLAMHISPSSSLRFSTSFGFVAFVAVVIAAFALDAHAEVELVQTPNGGMQPRAMVDEQGQLHLVYYRLRGKVGDLFYVTREPDADEWSEPLRVNSEQGAVPRNGAISLAQIALGEHGRLHVTWFEMKGRKYWYTRLDDANAAFEPQRTLVTQNNKGVETNAALACDTKGNVYAIWHAGKLRDESRRGVYMRRSENSGETFGAETRIDDNETGVCGCCALSAVVDKENTLYISYRAAGDSVHRDMTLLKSTDGGQNFSQETIDRWELNGCPVTTTTLTTHLEKGASVGWENEARAYFANVDDLANPVAVGPPLSEGRQKCLAMASDKDGLTLVAWMEGQGWRMGGVLHWKVFDSTGSPTNRSGKLNKPASRLSVPDAVAMPDGHFLIVY